VIEQEEPYEGRLSRTVLWERRGEIPLRDPTMHKAVEKIKNFAAHLRDKPAKALQIFCTFMSFIY